MIDKIMNYIKQSLFIKLFLVFIIIALIFVFIRIISGNYNDREKQKVLKFGIYEPALIEIGGVKQYVLLSGKNINNPILLILHGGPGSSETLAFRKYNKDIEDYFTIAYWDQRGTERSYYKDIKDSDLTLDRLLEDAHELTSYLKTRFKKDKIFLLGHSWGTYLGIKLISKYHEDYLAYIGIGQVANQNKSEEISYDFVLKKAYEEKNKKAIKELISIGKYNDKIINDKDKALKWFEIERKWVANFGGSTKNPKKLDEYMNAVLFGDYYSLSEKIRILQGEELKKSMVTLFPFMTDNLKETITNFKIPIYIFQGKNDYQVSYQISKEYFDLIEAPKKMFVTFEYSAHMVPFEEPEKFKLLMSDSILNLK